MPAKVYKALEMTARKTRRPVFCADFCVPIRTNVFCVATGCFSPGRKWVKKQRNCCQKDCITWRKSDGYAAKRRINVSKIKEIRLEITLSEEMLTGTKHNKSIPISFCNKGWLFTHFKSDSIS
ncbi:hypothetical protein [Arsenophonus nasoniae]|uniref:hypothetical protein n=1 Tax=Arsenophonus nasoniae TaxID=638 RepID=UPI001FEB8B6F|nr:hypothetical protein [Arsenophonus nasoniae]